MKGIKRKAHSAPTTPVSTLKKKFQKEDDETGEDSGVSSQLFLLFPFVDAGTEGDYDVTVKCT